MVMRSERTHHLPLALRILAFPKPVHQLTSSVGDGDLRKLQARFLQAPHEGGFHCTFSRHGRNVAKFIMVSGRVFGSMPGPLVHRPCDCLPRQKLLA